jgi:hypothetical protein
MKKGVGRELLMHAAQTAAVGGATSILIRSSSQEFLMPPNGISAAAGSAQRFIHGPEAFSKREVTGSDQQRANRGHRTSPDRDAAFI